MLSSRVGSREVWRWLDERFGGPGRDAGVERGNDARRRVGYGSGSAPGAGTVRSGARARRLRGGLRGRHQGPQVSRHRHPGPHGSEEPPAPRRVRLRGEHRGRGRDPDPDAPPVPHPRVRRPRHRAARDRTLRRGAGLPAPRHPRPRRVPGHPRAHRGRGGPGGARLAARPHRLVPDRAAFERKLYIIRKRAEHEVRKSAITTRQYFYLPSLSANTLIYKGMLSADQIEGMFPDVTDPLVESALALVHQRFSTNTFPSWPLAHPYRFIAHNGEINTLRGNINWMRAREGLLQSAVMGDDLKKILPIIREGGSDTAIFDNVLEFLVMTGRSLPHAILMMIPEPWSGHESMRPELKAFYEYHSSLMEPWDGPASIAFTDGSVVGAVLDRNGLRPSRYC